MHGEKLKEARISKNMSQSDVAKELNISRQSISKWENNKNTPDLENLILLGKLYQIPIDKLINGNNELDIEDKLNKAEITIDNSKTENFLWVLLLFLCCFTVIIAPLGLILIPFIIYKNRNNKTFKILIFSISIFCTIINIYQLCMIYGDHQKSEQMIMIEEIE
ncbi:helix-turn-helix domain-containing protein [Amedibacillus sp. YH-ame6]